MGELVITTTDKDLLADINAAAIDGVVINKPKMKVIKAAAIMTTAPDTSTINSVIEIGINFASDLARDLFAAWLYDQLIKKKPEKTKINGVEVLGENEDIKTQISKSIGYNHRRRKKNKKN